MAEFVCTRCGKCCISLGRYITIERHISPIRFYCHISTSRESIPVTITPEYRDLHAHDSHPPGACPFLRKLPENGGYICTIHPFRPSLCREFKCKTMIIFDHEGREAGSIAGKTSLITADKQLRALWDELVASMSREELFHELSLRGYRAEPLT